MFFVQLGCCDACATARHEDLVPEQKISAINFHDGRVADVNHLSSPNCRHVKTLCGSENSDNHSLSNHRCIHLLWSGDVHHSKSDCDGLRLRMPTKQIGRLVERASLSSHIIQFMRISGYDVHVSDHHTGYPHTPRKPKRASLPALSYSQWIGESVVQFWKSCRTCTAFGTCPVLPKFHVQFCHRVEDARLRDGRAWKNVHRNHVAREMRRNIWTMSGI